MPYRIKITDEQFESDIQGTDEWGRTVLRDFNDRIFRTRGEYRFVGHEGLFNLLYNHFTLGGTCEALEGRIYFNTGTDWDYEWKGDILPQDFEFDLYKRNVEGQVLDASWSSKFNNSNDQKVFLRSTTSRNEETISPCISYFCELFDPGDSVLGNYLSDERLCFRVYDVFNFLVDYHTSGSVTFTSTFFNTGGDGEQYFITTGSEIRQYTGGGNPETSFNEVFEQMSKKLNLWIIIEGTQANPVLRVEPYSYLFNDNKLLDIVNPEELKVSVDLDQLYTIINVGSQQVNYDPTDDSNYPNVRFVSWNDESYNISGDCQFENNALDLVSSWKIDNNTIEQTLGGNESFDDDIFLLEINPSTLQAIKYTTEYTGSDTVEYIYNYNLTNEQVVINWFNGIPGRLTKSIGPPYNVYANQPTTGFGAGQRELDYSNDSVPPGTDPDDIYDPLTNQFEAPLDGIFFYDAATTVIAAGYRQFRMRIKVWDDNNRTTLLQQVVGDYIVHPNIGTSNITMSGQIYLSTGNVVVFFIESLQTILIYNINSGYAQLNTDVPVYNETVNDTPLIYKYTIGRHQMSRSDFDLIDQGLGFVRILDTNGNKKYDVWVKELTYNSTKGHVTTGEFVGGIPPTQVCWVLETGFWNDECYWLDEELLVEDESDWFIITVDTTVAGKTNNDQFEFPLVGSANLLIDWGDGQIETGVTSTTTHTYGSTGTYTIKVAGTWTRFAFLTTTEDNDKVQTIEQWGDIGWGSMANAFFHCGNLTANYTDQPNVSNCSNFQQAFRQCTNFNGDVGGFDMSSATSLVNMFFNCTSFNNGGSDSIKDWNFNSVSGNISLAGCFYGCTSFNQPLTNWATNRVTTFSQFLYNCTNFDQPLNHFRFDICTTVFWMLRDCTAFDQNVEDWNMDTRPVGTYTDIMRGDTLSTANYDALLVGWLGWSGGAPTKTLPSNRTGVNFGNSTYSLGSDAADARNYLITTLSWTITDGGGV